MPSTHTPAEDSGEPREQTKEEPTPKGQKGVAEGEVKVECINKIVF